jgi:2-keto-3-deoxy-L-rhamnonate aldolase RhmA
MMISNRVKVALESGKVQIGTWVTTLGVPQVPVILASAGFDFIYLDMEHSCFSIETIGGMCASALARGLVPIVRPPAKEPHLLTRPLVAGALGLLIPHVDTPEEARAAVKATKFPPMGERGFNVQTVHTGFTMPDPQEFAKASNAAIFLIVQIESDEGIRNLDAILAVEGIDGAVVGRGDLSADLGLLGQTKHPEVVRRVEAMIKTCRTHKKFSGLLVPDLASAKEWIDKGIRLVPFSNDVTLLMSAGAKAIAEIRTYGPA